MAQDLFSMLVDGVKKYQNQVLFEFDHTQITAIQLFNDVLNFASINSYKFQGSNILILGQTSYKWVVAYFSIVISAGTAVLADPNIALNELEQLCIKYNIKIIISDKKSVSFSSFFNCHFICFEDIKIMRKYKNNFSLPDILEDNVCTIAFTSGTLNTSKGVMLSHKNLYSNIHAACSVYKFKSEDVLLAFLPCFHLFGLVTTLFVPIICGCKLVFSQVDRFFADLKSVKPSMLNFTPEAAKFLLNQIKLHGFLEATGGNLRSILCGGAQIEERVINYFQPFGVFVAGCYGMTECSPCVSINTLKNNKSGSAGVILDCNEVKISDVNNEILVKGNNVMIGYYNNKDLTDKTIVDGWFHTGDCGFFEDGFLIVTGRLKNLMVFSNGQKVQPEEIESFFYGYPQIDEVIVHEQNDKIVAKIFSHDFLEKTIGYKDIGNIVSNINTLLPIYKRINRFEMLDSACEKTILKKIKRRF